MTGPTPVRPLHEEMALLAETLQGLGLARAADAASSDHAGLLGPGPPTPEAGTATDRGRPSESGSAPSTGSPGGPRPESGRSGSGCSQCGCAVPAVCTACPVCRGAGLVTGLRPDALVRLADMAAMLADLLRAAADKRPSDAAHPHGVRVTVEDVPVRTADTDRPTAPGASSTPRDRTQPPDDSRSKETTGDLHRGT